MQFQEVYHLDELEGECVVAACSRILRSMSLITSNNCLKAERQSSHLFTWHKKAYWGLFQTLMFIPSSASSPQATENTMDYLIALYTDGRLRFHCHFMIQSCWSYLSGGKDGEYMRWRHHSLPYSVLYTLSLLLMLWGVHKLRGNTTSVCTLNSSVQINWSELGQRLLWFTA